MRNVQHEKLIGLSLVLLILAGTPSASAQVAQWPQFRGAGGSGLGGAASAPVDLKSPDTLLWKTDLPPGHSSPSIWGNRIFVTAADKATKNLEVLCLDRTTGRVLWRRSVTADNIERLHEIGSPAQASPAVDGERVYAAFGSYGLIAFDFEGQQKWTIPLPAANHAFGSAGSPIVVGDAVILSRDDNPEGYLLAVDRRTGATLWKQAYTVPNSRGAAGTATPVLWNDEIIVHRGPEVVAFDRKDGTKKWWVRTQSTSTGTPVVGRDAVYVGTWFPVGEPDLRVPLPDFSTLLQSDKNADGALSADELPETIQLAQRIEVAVKGANIAVPGKAMIGGLDWNKDGNVGKEEWEGFVASFASDHGLLAIKPGGQGDVTLTHVLWRESRGVPEVPTPLVSSNRVFMVTNGGIVTCMDATTGKVLFRTRLGAGGAYYASPVMAGEHLYFTSGDGVVTVIRDADQFTAVAMSDLAEPVFATPAIVDGHIYVRTATRLYAFRRAPPPSP